MTAEPSRLPVKAPKPAAPPPPKGLTPAARRFWRETVGAFELEPHHLSLLEQAARTLDVIAEAEAAIERDGAFVSGRFGVRSHPAAVIRDRNRLAFARLVRELGLDLEAPATSRPPTRWR
jgi:phage terminase small subunit